ncbi:hypothetical protein BDQ17DRAFT_1232992, partial [Cyathus striatus]
HATVTDSSKISAISSLGVQVFENSIANHFTAFPQATVFLYTHHFQLISPIQFLVVIPPSVITVQPDGGVALDTEYMTMFHWLNSQTKQLNAALKAFNSRKQKNVDSDEEE